MSHKRLDISFFTATILEWKHLLKPDKYKSIIIASLQFLVREKRIYLNGFVIMNNHIHLLWQIRDAHKESNVQRDFLKYTAQLIKNDLMKNHSDVLELFKVNAPDRKHQIWERNPLSVGIWSEAVFYQKLNYIHENPLRKGLCHKIDDYYFSSARFYTEGIDDFNMLQKIDY